MTDRYEVRWITSQGEQGVASFDDMDEAFDDCLQRWAEHGHRRCYAVRDAETEQRWSYSDIKELRAPRD